MAKIKTQKEAQDFAPPFSVLILKRHQAALDKVKLKSGISKSILIRIAVDYALRNGAFDQLAAS